VRKRSHNFYDLWRTQLEWTDEFGGVLYSEIRTRDAINMFDQIPIAAGDLKFVHVSHADVHGNCTREDYLNRLARFHSHLLDFMETPQGKWAQYEKSVAKSDLDFELQRYAHAIMSSMPWSRADKQETLETLACDDEDLIERELAFLRDAAREMGWATKTAQEKESLQSDAMQQWQTAAADATAGRQATPLLNLSSGGSD
jgi:hypothetical protein